MGLGPRFRDVSISAPGSSDGIFLVCPRSRLSLAPPGKLATIFVDRFPHLRRQDSSVIPFVLFPSCAHDCPAPLPLFSVLVTHVLVFPWASHFLSYGVYERVLANLTDHLLVLPPCPMTPPTFFAGHVCCIVVSDRVVATVSLNRPCALSFHEPGSVALPPFGCSHAAFDSVPVLLF